MSASLRFLALAMVGWAGVRAATLGALPGTEAFTLGRAVPPARAIAAADAPAIALTEFPALDEPASDLMQSAAAEALPGAQAAVVPAAIPIYYYPVSIPGGAPYVQASLPAPRRGRLTTIAPEPAAVFYAPIPQLDDWPLSRIASAAMPSRRSTTNAGQQSLPQPILQARLDRLQLSAWALLRSQPGPGGLAAGGTLGGSQAGARLTYQISPLLAASLRSSSPVGGGAGGGEVAAGIRVTPVRSIPISLTAERRQAIGSTGGGRSAFAMFVEGGVYQRPMPWGFELDAYAQAGVVGIRRRDLFADGALTFTRPLFGRYSAGFGMWGGVQPGLYRVDVGPRVSMRVRRNLRVHADWRQRVAGNAEPSSGPALTLAADF